jgi:hypothetical protein
MDLVSAHAELTAFSDGGEEEVELSAFDFSAGVFSNTLSYSGNMNAATKGNNARIDGDCTAYLGKNPGRGFVHASTPIPVMSVGSDGKGS